MYLSDIQRLFGGELHVGEQRSAADLVITSVGTIEHASETEITFLANPKYRSALDDSRAGAVIISPSNFDATTKPRIVTDNPYAYFAKVAQHFSPRTAYPPGVNTLAAINPTARVAKSASIAEFVSIGANAVIGERVRIGAGCVIGENVVIGDDGELAAHVTLYHHCVIGKRALLHAGVVIGADGFGFAHENGAWIKIPQTGRVVMGNDCEIGASSTIDRGTMQDTIIGNGVKIDNQVQVGHNSIIGDNTLISGCTGIAGSTTIGQRVIIGGAVSITGHLSICDDAILSANAFVMKSITTPGMYSAGMPLMPHREWLKNAAQLRHLDEMANKLKKLGK